MLMCTAMICGKRLRLPVASYLVFGDVFPFGKMDDESSGFGLTSPVS